VHENPTYILDQVSVDYYLALLLLWRWDSYKQGFVYH
jgi:hypothetical protein